MARRLLIRPGAIGDFIVSLPALEYSRADYTEIWAATNNLALARFADRARSIASVGLDRLGITHAGDVIERLSQFDSIYSWYGASNPDFRAFVRTLGLPFTFYDALPTGPLHAIDFYADQVGAPRGAMPRIESRLAQRVGLIVLHPFASNLEKQWPIKKFRKLAEMLALQYTVQWCRGPEDLLEGAFFQDNLYQLGTCLARASLYVGNDSGISHLAAAVDTPVIALFGPTDPKVWAPRGRKTEVMRLEASPEEVYDTIRSCTLL